MDNKKEIISILQRIRVMKSDLYDMENKLLKIGGFDWQEVAQFDKFSAIKMYKEKFEVDLKTAKVEVEDYLAMK